MQDEYYQGNVQPGYYDQPGYYNQSGYNNKRKTPLVWPLISLGLIFVDIIFCFIPSFSFGGAFGGLAGLFTDNKNISIFTLVRNLIDFGASEAEYYVIIGIIIVEALLMFTALLSLGISTLRSGPKRGATIASIVLMIIAFLIKLAFAILFLVAARVDTDGWGSLITIEPGMVEWGGIFLVLLTIVFLFILLSKIYSRPAAFDDYYNDDYRQIYEGGYDQGGYDQGGYDQYGDNGYYDGQMQGNGQDYDPYQQTYNNWPQNNQDNGYRPDNQGRGNYGGNQSAPQYDSSGATENSFPRGEVFCIRGDFAGFSFPISHSEVITIGKDPSTCNIVLRDNRISGRHCSIKYDGIKQLYYVTDHSTNGTYYSTGNRFVKEYAEPVKKGTKICITNHDTVFELR